MVELLNHIARLWWDWTASMFWQVGLLILVIACIDLLTRKWAWPQLRYALWSLILVKLLLPPSWSLPSSVIPELQPRVAQALQWLNSEKPTRSGKPAAIADFGLRMADWSLDPSPQFSAMAVADAGFQSSIADEDTITTGEALATNPPSAIRNLVTPDLDPGPQLHWQFYALTIWSLGTLILGIWLFLRLHSVAGRHAYRAAATSLPQSFYNHLADCAKRLGLRRIPRVAVTKRLTSPAVFGVLAPVLLVPRGYLSKLSRRDTEHMLLHELAHIKRGDLVMHSLYLLLQIVYWYNPLLWLVRRHLHHLRELSCDGTVAELLRERTLAYRQTLLETARRMLTTSVEPGLGLLGLFEDSNHLLVRLNWLTKPTWRYRTMKRVTVATIAVLMFACVLPMAQGQESASTERRAPVVRTEEDQQTPDQLSQEIASLQARLEELRAQQRELQAQLRALSEKRNQVRPSREAPRDSRERSGVRRRGERMPGDLEVAVPESRTGPGGGRARREATPDDLRVAPPEPRTGPGGGRPGREVAPREGERMPPEVREQVRRAQEQVRQAMKDAQKAQDAAKAHAEMEHAKAQEQQHGQEQLQAWAEQVEQWEQSEEMQKWQVDMEHWGQELGRRMSADSSAESSEVPEVAPVPPMPPMPALPAMPAAPGPVAAVPAVPHPAPHAGGGGAPHVVVPEIRVPHIEMPRITPPTPPAVPEKQEGQEEAVSRTEHTIDLAPGRLLEVKNEMGSIAVRGSNEPGCRLVVTVKGRADTMEEAEEIVDQVKPVIEASENGVYVAMTKPPQEDQREHVNRVVTMELVVPHEARLKLGQAFGDIRLTNLDGSVKAVSNLGSIRASGTSGEVALESNFGSIDFIVPKDLSAKVQAKSQMGSIQSDLPLEVIKPEGFSMGSKASGTIGDGEGNVSLTTNMGSIRIRSPSSEPARTERTRRAPRPEPQPQVQL